MDASRYYQTFNPEFSERVEILRENIKKNFHPVKEIFRRYYIAYSKQKIFCYIWFTSNNVYVYMGLKPGIRKNLQTVPKGVHSFFKSRYMYTSATQLDEIINLIKLSLDSII